MHVQDKLNSLLKKIKKNEHRSTAKQVELELKKEIIKFCKNQGFSKNKTLEILNELLIEYNEDETREAKPSDKKPATRGCVNHHWNRV